MFVYYIHIIKIISRFTDVTFPVLIQFYILKSLIILYQESKRFDQSIIGILFIHQYYYRKVTLGSLGLHFWLDKNFTSFSHSRLSYL